MITLTTLIEQTRALLMDGGSAVWDEATLTAAVRQAAGEYGLAAGGPVDIAGLDGALESTLRWPYDALVVWGAAAFAALARSADRAENLQPGADAAELRAWGSARLEEFHQMLRSVFPAFHAGEGERLAGLRAAESVPWAVWSEV